MKQVCFYIIFFVILFLLEQRNLRPSVSREPNLWSGVLEQFEESQEIADRRRVQKAEFEGVRDVSFISSDGYY